jgi:hypothetical protein
MTNKIFYTILILLILGSVGFTFWRIIVEKDYQIVAEVSCDPAVESCFHYEPEICAMDDYDCLSAPIEEAYDYKLINKKAANIYACEQTEEKTDCGEELSCLEGEENCEYTYCDPAELEEGEACAEPIKEENLETEVIAETETSEETD